MELLIIVCLVTVLSPIVVGFIWMMVNLGQQVRDAQQDNSDRQETIDGNSRSIWTKADQKWYQSGDQS